MIVTAAMAAVWPLVAVEPERMAAVFVQFRRKHVPGALPAPDWQRNTRDIRMVLRRIVFFLALLLGVVASQVPEYAQQYRQRLGGAVDELNRIIRAFDADAARMQMDRDTGIGRLIANPDMFVRQRGEQIREDVARAVRLEQQLQSYQAAGPFWRLASLARSYDPDIARRAAQSFEPAIPVTSEGLATTFIGFLVGWLGGRAAIVPLQRRQRRIRTGRA
jgi:hypothetical protein